MASRDVRVRVRPGVVRGRRGEPAVRAVVRVAAEQPQLKYPYTYLPRDLEALAGVKSLGASSPKTILVCPR